MAKLGEIIIQIRGVSYNPQDLYDTLNENSIPLLRANNIQNGNIVLADIVYVSKAKVSEKQYLKRGDILICTSSGSKELVGKAAFIEKDMPITFGAFCKVIRPIREYQKYIGYFFQSPYYRRRISELSAGANINNIRNEHIENLEICLPKIEEQQYIAAVLDKVTDLIAQRRAQLDKLDLLVKSRFAELFMWKGYPLKTVDEVSLGKGEYGAQSASIAYDPNRPRYVRITDINDDGTLNNDVVSSINPDDDDQYRLIYGDFLFARMGATVGKTYAFIGGNQIFAGYLIRYRLNQEIINPRYLFWFTKTDEYCNWVKLNQSGAAQPGINAKKYGSLRLPVPPIKDQNAFASFIENIEKSKLTIHKSLDKLEMIEKALMQNYFR